MDLTNLNDKQKEAVLYNEGPLLILAGAGSGKTRVLTHKVAYLIGEKDIPSENILAITFTNKAANEMKERIYKLVGSKAIGAQISTFHSLGVRILSENYELLGYRKNFTIFDNDDSLTLIKKILKDLDLDSNHYSQKGIKQHISGAKNELIDAKDYEKYVNTEFENIVFKVYKKYQESLIKNNCVDFDDLLMLPIKLFNEYPNVLKRYQEKFKYVLIDEYQDTNKAQYILAKMISAKYKNIFVVGDIDQSIYSFRGANYQNILNFESDYENTKVILLEENYRSTKTILNAANNVIKNNKNRKEKNLWCDNEDGVKIKYFRAFDERDEAFYVIREIKKLLEAGTKYEDIAILYRTNAQSRIIEEELLRENIPYKVIGSFFFYSRKEIKDLIAYLKLIVNEKDDVSLLRVINEPKRGIGLKTLSEITKRANEENISLFDAINSGKALDFKEVIIKLKEYSEKSTLTDLIDYVLDKTGMRDALKNEKTLEADIRLENLEEFKSITRGFEEKYGEISLEDFLTEITLVSDMSEHSDIEEAVRLMTIHSVKGLEFDNVFIIGLEEGIFPHINSMLNNNELEEERRLCYVAITRAKKRLYFVNARRRLLYGQDQVNPPSRFIKEVGDEYIEGKVEESKLDKEEMVYTEEQDYKVGDKVTHEKYGKGVIVGIDTNLVSVVFSNITGIKKFMKNHKSIKKI